MTVVLIRGLKRYRPPATGPKYIYHRKAGTRILPTPGTPELFAELVAIEARQPAVAAARPGTLAGLLQSYRLSRAFRDRSFDTRAQYERMLEKVRLLFDMPLVKINRAFISKLKDKLFEKHGHRTAAYVLAVLSVAFEHGFEVEIIAFNPVKRVRRPKKKALR